MSDTGQVLRVVVVDDEESFAKDWASRLEQGASEAGISIDPVALYGPELSDTLLSLAKKQQALSEGLEWDTDSPFGECDLLIVDADLRYVEGSALATGDDVVYLARCFTDVGGAVLLNAYGENSFDLTLKGRRTSFADAFVGSQQLHLPSLWRSAETGEFRPWSWPLLQDLASKSRMREEQVRGNLDAKIVDALRFEGSEIEALERSVASFLLDERSSPSPLAELTIGAFVTNSEYVLRRRDAEGVDLKNDCHAAMAARVGALRLSHWMNRVLAPTQDVVADAPRLATEFPSTLNVDTAPEEMNRTASLGVAAGTASDLLETLGFSSESVLSNHMITDPTWTDRPLWWGRRVRNSDLPEVERPWERPALDVRFAEDESQFRVASETEAFACDLATPYRMRYICPAAHTDVDYRPKQNRLTSDLKTS